MESTDLGSELGKCTVITCQVCHFVAIMRIYIMSFFVLSKKYAQKFSEQFRNEYFDQRRESAYERQDTHLRCALVVIAVPIPIPRFQHPGLRINP